MRDRYVEWANGLGPELRRAISDPAAWLMTLAVVLLVITLGGVIPQTRDFFHLRWGAALALFAPPFLVGIVGGYVEKRRPLSALTFGTVALADSAFFQLFAWSLVAFSSRPGSLLMAAFPVLLSAYHGHAYQASPRFPFQIIGTVLAAAGGIALDPFGDTPRILAVATPAAIVIALLLGTISANQDRERRKVAALREAVDAQVLQDRVREAERYKEMVFELRAHGHDAGNTLSSALINSESLLRAAYAAESGALPGNAREVAMDLKTGLERLSNILSEVREVGNRESLPRADIDVDEAIAAVLRHVQTQHPRIALRGPGPPEEPFVLSVYGGESTFHRILSNLVLNACEGDGRRGAANVWVDATLDAGARRCEIVVSDDGPGFSESQLGSGIPVFETSKRTGSGLGLYTVERLVAANQGAVSKRNRREGGAMVSVLLPIRSRS